MYKLPNHFSKFYFKMLNAPFLFPKGVRVITEDTLGPPHLLLLGPPLLLLLGPPLLLLLGPPLLLLLGPPLLLLLGPPLLLGPLFLLGPSLLLLLIITEDILIYR